MAGPLVEHGERRFPPAGAVVAGRYVVERVLGVGGMGAVVAAQDLQAGRLVAIKFLLPRCAEEALLVVRFEREARGTDRLRSEHVRRVLGAGVTEGTTPYLVMEYLDGEDLRALVRREGPLAVDRAARYVSQAGRALAEAHALGIVHRDLKPANLFLARQPAGDAIVKVVDFGVAKFDSPNVAGDSSDVSHAAQVLGSRHFMAPEQVLSPHSVDARADVWALGAILYYLLAAETPFAAPTAEEVTLNMLSAPPHPILARRPDLPPQLVAVIERCLERDRARRYPNVVELVRALAPFAGTTAEEGPQRSARGYLARTLDLGTLALPERPPAAPPPPMVKALRPLQRRGRARPTGSPAALPIVAALLAGGALAAAIVTPWSPTAPADPGPRRHRARAGRRGRRASTSGDDGSGGASAPGCEPAGAGVHRLVCPLADPRGRRRSVRRPGKRPPTRRLLPPPRRPRCPQPRRPAPRPRPRPLTACSASRTETKTRAEERERARSRRARPSFALRRCSGRHPALTRGR